MAKDGEYTFCRNMSEEVGHFLFMSSKWPMLQVAKTNLLIEFLFPFKDEPSIGHQYNF